MTLSQVLLHTRLFYNAGMWSHISEIATKPLEKMIFRILRVIGDMRSNSTVDFANEQIYLQLDALDVSMMLRVARLRYASRRFQMGTPMIFVLIRETSSMPHSWTAKLMEDMQWMLDVNGDVVQLPPPSHKCDVWLNLIANDPKRWCKMVMNTFRHGSAST
jgi:hypothetical protein